LFVGDSERRSNPARLGCSNPVEIDRWRHYVDNLARNSMDPNEVVADLRSNRDQPAKALAPELMRLNSPVEPDLRTNHR
jgi:hypothetical protein